MRNNLQFDIGSDEDADANATATNFITIWFGGKIQMLNDYNHKKIKIKFLSIYSVWV